MHSSASLAEVTRGVLADVTPFCRIRCGRSEADYFTLKPLALYFSPKAFELAAARGVCVALTARQFGLGREFWLWHSPVSCRLMLSQCYGAHSDRERNVRQDECG